VSPAADTAAEQSRQVQRVEWPGAAIRIVAVALVAALGVHLGLAGLRTPPVIPATEPVFSADRAAETMRRLGSMPRPIGSAANELAVRRIADWLRATGMEVEVDEATVRVGGRDVTLRNIVARRVGTLPGDAVLLCAHHDTTRDSPGAGDDGMGVAIVLEAAAALTGEPWKGRDVVLLITDGEEAGLLGARHFVNNHPWREKIGTVINVDNRGVSGPSILYETVGPDDARILQSIAPAVGPVVGNSLYAMIAAAMPNGSDLMVFREAGVRGINLAVIGGHEHYHAATDTWENADLDALQDLGDAVVTSVFSLAVDPADREPSTGNAVFLDVGGGRLAWWPERTGIVISGGCLVLITGMGWLGAKRRMKSSMDVLVAACLTTPCLLLAGLLAGVALSAPQWLGVFGPSTVTDDMLPLDAYRRAWWPVSGPVWQAAGMLAGIVGAASLARRLLRDLDGWATTCGAWMPMAAMTAALALLLPGASAPLVPILSLATLALAVAILAFEPSNQAAGLMATVVPAFVAGFLLSPLEVLTWAGVGLSLPVLTAARVVVLSSLVIALACPRGEPTT